ncbi:BQ5605_C024g09868 [Microbotryum silenes-dioicae]|uniref:BQ5605_C024g09868 protein n=1 Tax=Microbotryum silenes-dioicae TaxID=796604 RepID=A0A2X0MLT9_9BASI|nr:BQ5605_C024g09868 [Microbotryum silenes-dioicae]
MGGQGSPREKAERLVLGHDLTADFQQGDMELTPRLIFNMSTHRIKT